ncbi:glycosyltransferase family 2 protein [Olivibacter sp. XZL3]|uniref:glycosyltransferase family 2 protein n=1 Tax=Olivibacter sp. XZL3 TaxID=1735116 RepID=UPI001065FF74|nr:glycosyltransferase family 2 protein [Olivibacter sp. XZL3]
MALVSIISVNYKQPAVTAAFLQSIAAHASNLDLEVIIIDNESEQDLGGYFGNILPKVIYRRVEKNVGFAGGNNRGISIAQGDYLLFLNNDTEITPGMIEALLQVLEADQNVGMVSPLLLYYDNKQLIQYAGYTKMNYLSGRNKQIGYHELNRGQYAGISSETAYCHGAAMMVRKKDLDRVGWMDESYFLYYEELDWCEKFRKSGLRCWFHGEAIIYHKESISVGKESALKTYFMARNRMLFIRKNCALPVVICFSLFFIGVSSFKQTLSFIKKGRGDLIKWHYKGIWWNLTHRKQSKTLGFQL